MTLHVDDPRPSDVARLVVIERRFERMKVSEMRQDEIARPRMRAAEIEEMRERIALAQRLSRAEKLDKVAIAQARALLERVELLAEWERGAMGGAGPCMRIAPWKGNGHDGD